MTPVVDLLSTYLTRRCTIVAAEQEPHPDRRSPQEERQVQSTDGAAQREDGRDSRCSRKPISVVLHDTLLPCHGQDVNIAGGIGRRCGATRVMRGVFLWDSCPTTRRLKPFRGPKRRTSLSRCGRPDPLLKANSRRRHLGRLRRGVAPATGEGARTLQQSAPLVCGIPWPRRTLCQMAEAARKGSTCNQMR